MPNYSLSEIEGIGAVNSRKMATADIRTVQALLKAGGTAKGRKELAAKTGISDVLILKWVNMADLFRVKGVGKQYSELLEKAGVDTVKELRNRKAENLVAALEQANTATRRKLVQQLPGLTQVQGWIDAAKALPPAVTH